MTSWNSSKQVDTRHISIDTAPGSWTTTIWFSPLSSSKIMAEADLRCLVLYWALPMISWKMPREHSQFTQPEICLWETIHRGCGGGDLWYEVRDDWQDEITASNSTLNLEPVSWFLWRYVSIFKNGTPELDPGKEAAMLARRGRIGNFTIFLSLHSSVA